MYSKATVFGQALHPILVGFPIAFYASMLIGFLAYVATGKPICFEVAVVANVAGVVTAALAAIPGFIDWALGIPGGHPAKALGFLHMGVNVTGLFLATLNAVTQVPKFGEVGPTAGLAVVLSMAVMALTVVAGYFGGALVRLHHVGIDMTEEQTRVDMARAARGEHRHVSPRVAPLS